MCDPKNYSQTANDTNGLRKEVFLKFLRWSKTGTEVFLILFGIRNNHKNKLAE